MSKEIVYKKDVLDLISTMPPEEGITRALLIQSVKQLSSAQPEITHEAAVEYLQSTGWMQQHDREIYEMGLKAQLADDSGSYSALAELRRILEDDLK